MARSLPPSPSLEHLKKEAKDLLHKQRSGDASVVAVLKRLPQFVDAADLDILRVNIRLADAQQALAMDYGYKNWNVLRRLVTEAFTPDAQWAAEYYDDYRWSRGNPIGVGRLAKPAPGRKYFKFVHLRNGVRVEEYDAGWAFAGICHDPADRDLGDRKIKWQDGAARLDSEGRVRSYERYTVLADGDPPQVRAEIYTADGRLIETHTPHRLSGVAEDIHVTDRLGKLKVILHHRGINKGEPYEIEEEWCE